MSAWNRIKLVRVIVVNVLICCVFFLFLEGIARVFYPEFVNDYHGNNFTRGIRQYYGSIKGLQTRVPYSDYPLEQTIDKPLLIVIGDSISFGYGTDYEDIYWAHLQRLLDLFCVQSPRVLTVAGMGNNLIDELPALTDFLSSYPNSKVYGVIYQWNFNDITPYNSTRIKEELRPVEGTAVAKWRYKWLNRSVFLRVAQHYAGILTRKNRGSCEDRGMDALRCYTWTYGCKPFAEESERLWSQYGEYLRSFAQVCRAKGATPYLLVSPLLYHVDTVGADPYWNKLRLDFSCGTIDPLQRLKKYCDEQKIQIIDPTEYIRQSYNRRLKGGNFMPYWFAADEDHFNPVAATYLAEYLAKYLISQSPSQCVTTSQGEN